MSEVIEQVKAAGRNLWLAGLGAAAEVEEGGRELFGRLVERGRPVEGKLEGTQKKLADTVTEKANKAARELGKLVEETVEFESRGMLKKLNLMTREDVKILTARLETLSKKLDEYAVRREAAAVEVPVILDASGEPVKKAKTTKARTTQTTKTTKAAGKSGPKKG